MSAGVYKKVEVGAVVVNVEEVVGADQRVHFLRSAFAFVET